jgi:hypothetical protein
MTGLAQSAVALEPTMLTVSTGGHELCFQALRARARQVAESVLL